MIASTPRAFVLSLLLATSTARVPSEVLAPLDLRFSVSEGTRLSREWSRTSKRTLDKLSVTAGDETKVAEAPGVAVESKARLAVTDLFARVDGDRVRRIERTYDAIEKTATETASTPEGDRERVQKEVCDLDGRTVVFEWDEESRAYTRSLQGGSANADSEASLARLVPEMDLQGFLPSTSVVPGDHWSVDMDAIRFGFLRPGGRLVFTSVDGKRKAKNEEALSESAWDALEGSCTATFTEIRDDGGAPLCVIHLVGQFSTSAEIESSDGTRSTAMKHSETYEGDLVWDAHAAHARSLELESKTEFTLIESAQGKKEDGSEVRVQRTLEFSEDTRCEYSIREL